MSIVPTVQTRQAHGKGKAVLHAFGRETTFSELSYTYPLKLLSPKLPSVGTHPVSIAYILSYGGGLVPGDRIDLDIEVGEGASLMLLTQGSTKVFKTRMDEGSRLANDSRMTTDGSATINRNMSSDTIQRMDVKIGKSGLLLLLVDPVTCFRAASYKQIQTFYLEADASLVLLDWFTAGRVSRGEEWAFAKYYSVNEVWRDNKRCARDVMLLEQPLDMPSLPHRTLKDRLSPYTCYATLLMFGPVVAGVTARLTAEYDVISQMQLRNPPPLLWSLSSIDGGWIVRVAGCETEAVKEWLKTALQDLSSVVGQEVYSKAFV